MSCKAVLLITTIHIMCPSLTFIDFSIYVDAPEALLQSWYINRFLKFRQGAFSDPNSYFYHYFQLSEEEVIAIAKQL